MKLSMWCWVGWIRKVGNFRHHILVQIADSNLLRSIFADWNRSTVDLYRRHLNHRPLSERWLCLCIERPWFDFSALSREFLRHEKGQESSLQIPATFFKSFAVKRKLKTELFSSKTQLSTFVVVQRAEKWELWLCRYNIARYNLIDTKYRQMALRSARWPCSRMLFGNPRSNKSEWWPSEGDNPWNLLFSSRIAFHLLKALDNY